MNGPKPFTEDTLQPLLSHLAGRESFVFLESTRVTSENHRSYLFLDPSARLVCKPGDDPAVFFRRVQEKITQGFFLAGYIGYELGYLLEPILAKSFTPRPAPFDARRQMPLADLGVFRDVRVFDHLTGSSAGTRPWPAEKKAGAKEGFSVDRLRLNLEREEYIAAIRRIKSYIEAGDTYQVNFTLKLLFDFKGSLPAFYCSLRRNQSVSYGGMIQSGDTIIFTFSPELFFRKQGNVIHVRPMKGTMPRGRTTSEDRRIAEILQKDIKNRSENVMIVDLLRNDLGRLSRMGGVSVQSLFDIETYETLHQMTSSIRGELDRPVTLEETFKALFPCGSVTGAPKIRTMEIIRELEAEDRGVYTGAIGFIAPDGDAVFNVPIRTVVVQGGMGEMGTGSGIVWDSDPVAEWEECCLKGRFLTAPAPEFKLIETMLWHPETGYWLLEQHLDRLADSALYFSFPINIQNVAETLHELAEDFGRTAPRQGRRVRLTLSKAGAVELTSAALAESGFPVIDPAVAMHKKSGGQPPKVVFSSRHTDSGSPYLFHKTTMRRHYDDARRELVEGSGYYEVLFVNEKGEVAEGSYTNVFLQKNNRLVTPPVACGLLPGILRQYLLQEYPDLVVEQVLTRDDLKQAEAVYVGNSVRGLVRVMLIDN